MALSTQTVVSDGSLVLLDISIEYLERSEIAVYFNSVPTTAWAWVGTTDKQITFSPAVPAGVIVLLRRTTDMSVIRHEFSLGAAFTAEYLDEALKQTLHIAQEGVEANFGGDFYDDIDMHMNGVHNVADPVAAQDAATKNYVDTGVNSGVVAAAASAASASTSASNAATSASAASTSATNAASSASAAATSATNAAASATSAAGSATTATTQASNASTSATNAANSATAAAASYDSFDDRYLGPKASAPTLDNDGNALLTGALYFDTSTGRMRVWGGSAWGDAGPSGIIGAISDGSAGTFSFRNKLVNAAMWVAQRQTSKAQQTDGEMVCDRWFWSGNGTSTRSMEQLFFAPGQEPETGVYAYLKVAQSAASGQTWTNVGQCVEFVRTLNGDVCTLSAWIAASEDGGGPVTVTPALLQNFGTGGSTRVDTTLTGQVVSGTWTKYTWTFTMPSIAGKTIGANSQVSVVFSAGVNRNYTLYLTGVQLEQGAVATPFEYLPYAETISQCLRYYRKLELYDAGYGLAGTSIRRVYTLGEAMRVAPTVTSLGDWGSGNVNSVGAVATGDKEYFWVASVTATGNYSIDWGFSLNAEF